MRRRESIRRESLAFERYMASFTDEDLDMVSDAVIAQRIKPPKAWSMDEAILFCTEDDTHAFGV